MIFNQPSHQYARNSAGSDIKIPYNVIHQSWARTDDEVLTKIKNWGHAHNFDVMKFYQQWKNLNENNYTEYFDFHPIYPGIWNSLEFVEATTVGELLVQMSNTENVLPLRTSSHLKKLKIKSFLGF